MVLAIILIIYGLQNETQNKTFFNVSRLLALLSVAGIWYFGNVLTKNTDLKITQNEIDNTTLALNLENQKTETEIAKQKAENFRLAIQKANLDAQNAKQKTKELDLEVQKAKLEVENARLERDRIKDKMNYVKSLYVIISYKIPVKKVNNFNRGTMSLDLERKQFSSIFLTTDTFPAELYGELKPISLGFTSGTRGLQKADLKVVTLRYEEIKFPERIIGKRLDLFKYFKGIQTYDLSLMKKYKKEHVSTKKIELQFELFINGVRVINKSILEKKPGEFFENNKRHDFKEEFDKIYNILLN